MSAPCLETGGTSLRVALFGAKGRNLKGALKIGGRMSNEPKTDAEVVKGVGWIMTKSKTQQKLMRAKLWMAERYIHQLIYELDESMAYSSSESVTNRLASDSD